MSGGSTCLLVNCSLACPSAPSSPPLLGLLPFNAGSAERGLRMWLAKMSGLSPSTADDVGLFVMMVLFWGLKRSRTNIEHTHVFLRWTWMTVLAGLSACRRKSNGHSKRVFLPSVESESEAPQQGILQPAILHRSPGGCFLQAALCRDRSKDQKSGKPPKIIALGCKTGASAKRTIKHVGSQPHLDTYPLLQIPSFFRVSCRPFTKKRGIYHGKPIGFPKNTLKKSGYFEVGGTLATQLLGNIFASVLEAVQTPAFSQSLRLEENGGFLVCYWVGSFTLDFNFLGNQGGFH